MESEREFGDYGMEGDSFLLEFKEPKETENIFL